MNKTAIKNFAVWARKKLIADITYKAGLLGVSEKGIAQPLPQSSRDLQFFDIGTKDYAQVAGKEIAQRNALVGVIREKEAGSDYASAFQSVVEEAAYTWFNRLIAIRFMEVNEYLPSGIRVLSSENPAKNEPDFVTAPFDAAMEFTPEEQDEIMLLKDENKLDELFRMLFIKQCNQLHEILPELFEETNDYTELLLSISFTDRDGVLYHLVHDIKEDDFNVEKEGQVEIIGWLYQYYISEKHDQIVNIYKGTVKKEDIPAATQLFTTDWVVRYMVDNSLGRYWLERHPESNLAEKLQFFVTPKDGKIAYIDEKVEPEELTFFDPCMGSGHILVYAFDVLMEIYREAGYTDRDAAISILENNLFGLDIDQRAYQLAYFAVMMKARSYNRRIFSKGARCNVAVINESNGIDQFTQANVTADQKQNEIGEYLIDVFRHAKEIGSLQTIEAYDYDAFSEYVESCSAGQIDLFAEAWSRYTVPVIRKLVEQAKIMSRKYAVVCTNPPYMNKLEGQLKKFVVDKYKPYSGDLFSVFMYRNFGFCRENGYSAFMTPFVWMFIKTYENLRLYIIDNKHITTLIQMEYSAFEEATVPICSFVLQNAKSVAHSLCFRLSDFKGGMEVQKEKVLEALGNKDCGYFYEADQSNFSKIPGSPVAYWVNEIIFNAFLTSKVDSVAFSDGQILTGDNNKYLRMIWEVDTTQIRKDGNWMFHAKGGEYRKWYGNLEWVVKWSPDAIRHYKQDKIARFPKEYILFRKGVTWSLVSTNPTFGARLLHERETFNKAAATILFNNEKYVDYTLALVNSSVINYLAKIINPTLNNNIKDILAMPFIYNEDKADKICELSQSCIDITKLDWDSFETSWDFKHHPFLDFMIACGFADEDLMQKFTVSSSFSGWKSICDARFKQLKANEEELNRIFIKIYGLQGELTPEVEDKDVTVRKADLQRDIKSLLSYAVGCMFGRYSLDEPGLAYAGGEWDSGKYGSFIPDKDNCIPITDEPYFEDDIVGLLCAWLKKVYGEDTLEENLDFIAKALGNKGTTSRGIIRNYFLTDFIKDHIKIYQKRPIYWLFDSGKQNGFKALVYMHRWNADTVGNLRVEYLHRMQHAYEREIIRMQEMIDNSKDSREISKATKRKDKLQKQLKETKDYDAKLAHIALSRIDIDLDDGVKVNYEKVQTGRDGRKMQILAKI